MAITFDLGAQQAQQQRALIRVRRFSTGLFVAVSLLYVAARWFESRQPQLAVPWGMLAAFSEAAMVGALADWFAVVALFRHPLGIPLPHTAIIPKNRGRIADNLGAFITGNFLQTEVIVRRIREFDPARRLADWLVKPESASMLGAYGVRALGFALKAIGDERFLRFFQSSVLARMERMDVARLGGELLDVLTQDRRHQELLDALIHHLRTLLAQPATQEKVAGLITREYDNWRKAVLGTLKIDAMIGKYSAEKLVTAASRLLDEVDADPAHPLRLQFDHVVAEFVSRLKADATLRANGELIRDRLLHSPEITGYLHELWQQLHTWLDADLANPQSSIRARVVAITLELGESLQSDAAMQEWINDQFLDMARPLCDEQRGNIGRFISSQVKSWDQDYMVQQVELNIGKDLQYIRINGTLIGGIAGLLIYGGTALLR